CGSADFSNIALATLSLLASSSLSSAASARPCQAFAVCHCTWRATASFEIDWCRSCFKSWTYLPTKSSLTRLPPVAIGSDLQPFGLVVDLLVIPVFVFGLFLHRQEAAAHRDVAIALHAVRLLQLVPHPGQQCPRAAPSVLVFHEGR